MYIYTYIYIYIERERERSEERGERERGQKERERERETKRETKQAKQAKLSQAVVDVVCCCFFSRKPILGTLKYLSMHCGFHLAFL